MRGVFVIKIIYNKDKDLRIIEDALDNSLDNLHFYIPKKLQGNFYCRLVDTNDTESILKLAKSDSSDKLYDIYKVSLDNFVSCVNGKIDLSILHLEDRLPYISSSVHLDINFDKCKTAMQLYFMDDLTSNIVSKYKKIVELTEMNINIYKDIKEVLDK